MYMFVFLHDIKMPKSVSAAIARGVLNREETEKSTLSILVSNLILDRQRTYFHTPVSYQIKRQTSCLHEIDV